MNVVFFRHGPAVPRGTGGLTDPERPLTPEGRKKTGEAAQGLKALDLGIDAIFTSPLVRAQETAEILARTLDLKVKVLDSLRTGVAPRRLIASLAGLSEKTPVLVGHEPQLSAAIALAVCGTSRDSIEMKKAGMALVDLDARAPRPRGLLKLLMTGSALRSASKHR